MDMVGYIRDDCERRMIWVIYYMALSLLVEISNNI